VTENLNTTLSQIINLRFYYSVGSITGYVMGQLGSLGVRSNQ